MTAQIALVVEPDAFIRFDASQTLQELGWQTVEAVDSFQAVELARDLPVCSLLLTAASTTGPVGALGLIDRMRERWPDLPALVASAGEMRQEDLPAGSLIVRKPFSPEQIQNALDLLTGHKAF